MKEDFDKLLSEIDVEIAKIDLYGNDIIETSLSIAVSYTHLTLPTN